MLQTKEKMWKGTNWDFQRKILEQYFGTAFLERLEKDENTAVNYKRGKRKYYFHTILNLNIYQNWNLMC